jgi:transaldolase
VVAAQEHGHVEGIRRFPSRSRGMALGSPCMALEDLVRAAGLFRTIYNHKKDVDGVSLEVSPTVGRPTTRPTPLPRLGTCARVRRAQNPFRENPGTPERLPAISYRTGDFFGLSVNVTLLFSYEHYLDAAETYLRGMERRMVASRYRNVGPVD